MVYLKRAAGSLSALGVGVSTFPDKGLVEIGGAPVLR